MAKVFLVCGKICSGKTYYSSRLKEEKKAVLLSCDEILFDIFHHDTGENHDQIVKDIKHYLLKKALQIVKAGTNVILDWGFWTKEERQMVTNYFQQGSIAYEWHYIDLSYEQWQRNIEARNLAVKSKSTTDYSIDEGLLKKFMGLFEEPDKEKIVGWVIVKND